MNMRRLSIIVALVGLAALSAYGADITGKWKSESPGRDGTPMTTTYVFKVDGEKLAGTVSGRQGETAISEGKINGDEISFVVVRNFQGEERKIEYKGKVSGDEIKMTITFGPDRPAREVVAKRVKE
jgi:uncharacterized lipoprotein YehR (DUF1307 family)